MATRIAWSTTNRGKPLLIDENNHAYRFNKRNKGKVFYLCRKYDELKCRAMVSIENENANKGVLIGSHVHGSNIGKKMATELVRNELQKAKDNPDKPVRMVLGDISNQLENVPSVAAVHFMTSSNTLRRKINRDRQNMFSDVPLPATPAEFLNVPSEYAEING